jgi:hypothetical protein
MVTLELDAKLKQMENRQNNTYANYPHSDQLPQRDILLMKARAGAGQGPGCVTAIKTSPILATERRVIGSWGHYASVQPQQRR